MTNNGSNTAKAKTKRTISIPGEAQNARPRSALRVSSPSGNQVDGSPLVADTETVAKPAGRGGARQHEKAVFEVHCSLKVPGNYNNCCGEGIEVYRNGLKVWE